MYLECMLIPTDYHTLTFLALVLKLSSNHLRYGVASRALYGKKNCSTSAV